jgi:hypothetical protein
MAEMRLPARCSILLAGLLLLTLPALAAAEPKPIAKPTDIAPIKPTKSSTPSASTPVQPSTPPAAPPAAPPAPPSPPATGSVTRSTGTHAPVTRTKAPAIVIVATAQGGRDQSGISVPAPPPPEPTPLGLVAAGDRVTSPGTSTPAWKIALLALLAAAEAFLVVRLVRNRPGGDLSPAS